MSMPGNKAGRPFRCVSPYKLVGKDLLHLLLILPVHMPSVIISTNYTMKRELHPITGKIKMVARPENYRENANCHTASLPNPQGKGSHPLKGPVDARRPFSAPVASCSNASAAAPRRICSLGEDGCSEHCAERSNVHATFLDGPSPMHAGIDAFSSQLLNSRDRGESLPLPLPLTFFYCKRLSLLTTFCVSSLPSPR